MTEMIYIVDDAADYRFLLQQVFTRFVPEYPVRFFPSGDALYQHVQAGGARPQLILLDLNMPGLSGYQTLMLLKQHSDWKHVPVVMMSNAQSNAELEQCYQAGVNSFLTKPGDFNRLTDLMRLIGHYWIGENQLAVQPQTPDPAGVRVR